MKILVVDDNARHRLAAQVQLTASGHEVISLHLYADTVRIAAQHATQGKPFQMAMLDLLMPAEAFTLGSEARENFLGELTGVGFPLALALALCGIPYIAVVTDTHHHNHPMSAIVDWFGPGRAMRVVNSIVVIRHAPMRDGIKDWPEILRAFLEDTKCD